MFKKVMNWALGLGFLGKLGQALNGKKTAIGAISLLLATLRLVPNVFPECGMCPEIADGIQQALEWVGVVLVPVGIAHKAVK
jgi:hypothetical protein